jgi:hypothetical protein
MMRIAKSTSVHAVISFAYEHSEFSFAVGVLSAAWFYYPYCQTGPTLCVWKKLLGVSCPGCGLTRGVCFLVHGRWAEAIRLNPLSPLAVAILLCNIVNETSRYVGDFGRRRIRIFGRRRPWIISIARFTNVHG